ncbi:MAG: hypothetical protein O2795_16295 [Acidobacteria bacterium]|nr:hypothetical protein [Acidobacteriota bacterium]
MGSSPTRLTISCLSLVVSPDPVTGDDNVAGGGTLARRRTKLLDRSGSPICQVSGAWIRATKPLE